MVVYAVLSRQYGEAEQRSRTTKQDNEAVWQSRTAKLPLLSRTAKQYGLSSMAKLPLLSRTAKQCWLTDANSEAVWLSGMAKQDS